MKTIECAHPITSMAFAHPPHRHNYAPCLVLVEHSVSSNTKNA